MSSQRQQQYPHRRFPGRAALTALHGATEDRPQTRRVAKQRAETQLSGQALPLSSEKHRIFTLCMLEIYTVPFKIIFQWEYSGLFWNIPECSRIFQNVLEYRDIGWYSQKVPKFRAVINSGIFVNCFMEHRFVPYSLHLNSCNSVTND